MATATEIKNFINRLGALAVNESNRRIAAGQGFVLPSVCIAQSALETGWGTSGLMTRANAFFGIKAGGSWTGAVYTADTWEVANGEAYNTTANFRAYSSLEASVKDYYDLIGNNSRYSKALSFGTSRASWKSPKECITAIWAGGYATDTLYVEKIMSTINARDLAAFDAKIDGVSYLPSSYGDTKVFSAADLLAGSLEITDSGRTISRNSSAAGFLTMDWDKAPTLEGVYNISVNDANGAFKAIYLARLVEDSPSIEEVLNGQNVSFNAATKAALYFELNEGFTSVEDIGAVVISLINANDPILSGAEIVRAAIASFVKIE